MTKANGIGCLQVYGEAITADYFICFLKLLRAKHKKQSLALFMDQLAVHKSRHVHPWYDKLDITPVYNVAYSPEFNPIESIFSRVKAIFN